MAVRRFYKTAILVVAVVTFLSAATDLSAQKFRDLIVVLDVSSSMASLFDTAKDEAKHFISSAQIGDRITVITFGKRTHLLVRTRVKSSHTIGRVLSEIDKLSPVELNTNLPMAMEAGLSEMEQFYKDTPDAERTLMWLSDNKDNPPADFPNLITFASLKEEHTKRVPDRNWFVFKKPIETDSDDEVDWFVDWTKRNNMVLKAELPVKNLGSMELPTNEAEFDVTFDPDSAGIWGTSFTVVAEVTDEERGNYSASVPITPSTIVCDSKTWTQKFKISFPDRAGTYVCRISFVLPSDKLLEISPPQLTLDAKLVQPLAEQEKTIAAIDKTFDTNYHATLNNRTNSDSIFSREIRGQLINDFKGAIQHEMLVFGPIVSGGQYRESASLTVAEDVPVDAISLETTFSLPEGMTLQPEFRRSDGANVVADLCLLVDETLLPDDGWEVKGVISFLTNSRAKVFPSSIPIRLYTRPDLSSWGRRQIEMNPTYAKVSEVAGQVKEVAVTVGKVGIVLFFLWLFLYLIQRYFFTTTDLVGMLEIVKNPTRQRIRYFNLQRLGKLKKRNSLTIGRSRKADIVLPHPSVGDLHAKIMTTKIDTSVIIFIQPLEGNQIKVNDITYSRQKEMSDCDKLIIGEFVFMYKRPEVYRETVVHFNNGASIRGTLISWDIDSTSFEFLPANAPSISARKKIEFSALKMVTFVKRVKRFSRENLFGPARTMGYPVEVFFKDGELLEGYMMTETGEWSKRFYVIPKNSDEVALVLVERTAVESVVKCEHFKQSFFHLRRFLRALTPHTSS
jgi:hypothetical protein